MREFKMLSLMALVLPLAACGGGAGSGLSSSPPPPTGPTPTPTPGPTPTPTPTPTAVNSSLLNLTASESFANSAASGAVTFPTNDSPPTTSASQATAKIAYDNTVKSYTLTISGRSQTFRLSDIDKSQSSDAVTVYIRTNGATTDSLTLTNPGTSGRFTYKYVGAAFWQRTTTGSSAISGSFDAFAYGVATPQTALPRTGRAEYQVDLIGVETVADNVFAITGQGTTQIDFSSGAVVTHGTSGAAITGSGTFSSEALLSSSGNSFSGNFRFDDFGQFVGDIDGQLYGPSAEEIGAAFSAEQSDGRVVVGALIGRGSPVTVTNTSVKSLTVDEFFTNDAAKLDVTLKGSSGVNNGTESFTSGSAGASPLIVNYDASTNAYTVIAADRSQYFLGNTSLGTTTETFMDTTPTSDLRGYDYPTFSNLRYAASKRWLTATGAGADTQYRIEDLVYGVETPDSALPRTGQAGYAIGVSGMAADADFANLAYITGFGFLVADFASGSLTTSGQMRFTEDYQLAGRRPGSITGNFTGNASISSTTNSFTGPISFDGLGPYSGTMNGRFYGPAAEEVGAAFSASDGSGGIAQGTFIGGIDAAALETISTISALTAPTTFTFDAGVFTQGAPSLAVTEVKYDPASKTYSISVNDAGLAGSPTFTFALSPANRDSKASDASFDVFQGTVGGEKYAATVLKPVASNPTIALSYTSLAIIKPIPGLENDGTPRFPYYIAFGLPTSGSRMPIGGTATYTGIARGEGSTLTNAYSGGSPPSVTNHYDLTGTVSFTADFSDASFSSLLKLTGKDVASGASHAFSPITFNGEISGDSFTTHQNGLSLAGHFYGPHAEEFGGSFAYSQSDNADTLTQLNGAVVGKR